MMEKFCTSAWKNWKTEALEDWFITLLWSLVSAGSGYSILEHSQSITRGISTWVKQLIWEPYWNNRTTTLIHQYSKYIGTLIIGLVRTQVALLEEYCGPRLRLNNLSQFLKHCAKSVNDTEV
eukprot:TRINITY_DN5022_c0_g1_i2.p1 TRINITY_DN5022_c0_g1~~TRINITY_DN5022_c0_g1_i2.p1  ORF type:complete len:122 (-),score=6.75 TRINITY_DN5022_c0_g1_i2:77-442(-)